MAKHTSSYEKHVVQNSQRSKAVADLALRLISGKLKHSFINSGPGIIFVQRKAHAEQLANILTEQGQSCVDFAAIPYVTSDTPTAERNKIIKALKEQRLPVVVATEVWRTGLDIPELAWIIWAGARQAPIGLKQACGRGSRLAKGKNGYVIFDICDEGMAVPGFRKSVERRLKHYTDYGLAVDTCALSTQQNTAAIMLDHVLQQNVGKSAYGRHTAHNQRITPSTAKAQVNPGVQKESIWTDCPGPKILKGIGYVVLFLLCLRGLELTCNMLGI